MDIHQPPLNQKDLRKPNHSAALRWHASSHVEPLPKYIQQQRSVELILMVCLWI